MLWHHYTGDKWYDFLWHWRLVIHLSPVPQGEVPASQLFSPAHTQLRMPLDPLLHSSGRNLHCSRFWTPGRGKKKLFSELSMLRKWSMWTVQSTVRVLYVWNPIQLKMCSTVSEVTGKCLRLYQRFLITLLIVRNANSHLWSFHRKW